MPSGTALIGLSFVLRDVGQYALRRRWITWAAIAVGIGLSYWLADAAVATASAVGFAWSETTDAVAFTAANRGGGRAFTVAVVVSGVLASVVDSILFLWIAFDSTHGWWDLFVVKSLFVLLAAPVAYAARRSLRSDVVPGDVAV